MGEPYYRITTAKSELDGLLYQSDSLGERVTRASAINKTQGGDGVVPISIIKRTHRYPFRSAFMPCIISANQWLSFESQTNKSFKIEYSGEFAARMYLAISISAGTIATVSPPDVFGFAYCDNFVASLINTIAYKVSSDTLYEFQGSMYFVWYSLIAPMSSRPALQRCLRETCYETRWVNGVSSGGLEAQPSLTSSVAIGFQTPYTPIQAFESTHPAFTVYIPLNLFTLANVDSADPLIGAYSLERKIEIQLNPLINCINVYAINATSTDEGFISQTSPAAVFTWTNMPAITTMRLLVEFFTIQKELQDTFALNPHGFLIRQYFNTPENITDATYRELSATKIVESVYFVCRHEHNVTPTAMDFAVSNVVLADGPVEEFHKVDPFFLPINEKPLQSVTISARGQTFYKELSWDEISAVFPFLYSTTLNSTTTNHCVGVITFAHFYAMKEHTGSYNSGYGPNLTVTWRASIFSSADPGRLDIILQCENMVLVYRGAVSIRYT